MTLPGINDQSGTTIPLANQLERIALEAGFKDTITDLLADYIPGIYKLFNGLSESLTSGTNKKNQVIITKYSKLVRHGYKYDTLEPIASRLVRIPTGLDDYIVNYIPALLESITVIDTLAKDSLADFNFSLTKAISDSEYKSSFLDRSSKYKKIDSIRVKVIDDLDGYLGSGKDTDKLPVGTVLERLSDMDKILSTTKDLTDSSAVKDIPSIKDEVDKTIGLMSVFLKRIKDSSMDDLNSSVAKSISEESYVLGKVIELLTVLVYRVDIAMESVIELSELTLKKA